MNGQSHKFQCSDLVTVSLVEVRKNILRSCERDWCVETGEHKGKRHSFDVVTSP